MSQMRRIAIIGNSLPRRCGIATFTNDLEQALIAADPGIDIAIVAMNDHGHGYDYPEAVRFQIADQRMADYVRAADYLNAGQFDVVCLQHEFGIFGGEAGAHITALLSRLTVPVVTTFHTILAEPTAIQRTVLQRVAELSTRVVVMAAKGRDLLQTVYRVAAEKIDVIPHGIPDLAFLEPGPAKQKLGFQDRSVILTFGLLSPNKGIEVMIDAMPSILQNRPDAVYVVLGATHPNLVRTEGEVYREGLQLRARQLGVQDHVVFLNQFVDQSMLLDFISMCDVYVTPYLHEAQMTSGTLAYSFGLGKAVVSTPYWHARELLADGRGVLVPFDDAQAIGDAISDLLTDDARRQAMRQRAYASSRAMTWARTAERYLGRFETARRTYRGKLPPAPDRNKTTRIAPAQPQMQTAYFRSMCDDTGMYQHAVYSVPDRRHGYCIDDNARALLLACLLERPGEQRLPEILTTRFASFIQHAWNRDTGRFRNFMGFDRRWLEDTGSEDSHGRTLWALGVTAQGVAGSPLHPAAPLRSWAAALFAEALPVVESFSSPRAWAFTLLGLDAYCAAFEDDMVAYGIRARLAERLMALLVQTESDDWVWFEEGLAYDNGRLSQALIVTGLATQNSDQVSAGLRSLRWLTDLQTTPAGFFRPFGTSGFGDKRKAPQDFDQQPVEATAMISACLAAWRADGRIGWKADATRIFDWFFGGNDLWLPLVDGETGSCRDGLHPDRANENRGAESVLSYLLSVADMRQLARQSGERESPVALQALQA